VLGLALQHRDTLVMMPKVPDLAPFTRRGLFKGAAVVGAGLILPAELASTASAASGTKGVSGDVRQTKTLFGAFAGPYLYPNDNPFEAKVQMRARVCAAMGTAELPVERIFNENTWVVPEAGRPAIVSFTQNPSSVAAGDFDGQITAFVQALDPNTRYWLCLNHECDQTTRSYSPAEQVAGFRHFSTVVRAVGKARVKLVPILMSWTLTRGVDFWRQWYPGAAYVDALGWDAYWRPTLKHTAADVYGGVLAVTRAEKKPMLICETSLGAQGHGGQQLVDGVYQDIPDSIWTQFTTDAIAYLNIPGVAAVTWFETNKTDGRWLLEDHPEALAIYSSAVAACGRPKGRRDHARLPSAS
jgi:Glycosyl hydrolase family 26